MCAAEARHAAAKTDSVAYRLLTGEDRRRPTWSRREPTTGADGEAAPAAKPATGVPALPFPRRRDIVLKPGERRPADEGRQ